MDLTKYVERLGQVARQARSESKLEVETTAILRDCLGEAGIHFDPAINETLKSLGLSQVDADRPDGVFGHIVYDYKDPDLLSSTAELKKGKIQIEKYLDSITSGGHKVDPAVCAQWFAYLYDGFSFAFCHSDGEKWAWSDRTQLSENSLMFLIHAYRSLKRKPLTAALLSASFGKSSQVAREMIRVMCSHLAKPRHKTNMLFREWKRLFEQVSTYDLDQIPSLRHWTDEIGVASKDASHILFAMHTYYSLVVKLLTSELLAAPVNGTSTCRSLATAPSQNALFAALKSLEDSEHYKHFRISNFLEGDFFSWYTIERSKPLADAIRDLAVEFLDFEPATAYLMPGRIKDLLKEFYSSLVDEQIRHDLGEYYTPDWLAQHLLDRVDYHGNPAHTILDPTCGSGTFLVECIIRLKAHCATAGMSKLETLRTILKRIKGLDLNPLAVISSRANYILSISDLVFELGHDIEIPVYLADSINVPVEKADTTGTAYLEYNLDTEVQTFGIRIPLVLVKAQVLGRILLHCEDAIARRQSFADFLRVLRREKDIADLLSDTVLEYLDDFYKTIESLEKRDWDRIWCRILKNNFSPKGFAPFDLIVGNPPWVRWSRLPENYRNRVKAFCNHYGLVSGRGYAGGIESDISTVITYSAADNWLAEGGKVAFLITWTVFKTGSARGFRLSELPDKTGLRVVLIEDMTAIQPFPDATNQTAVYVAEKVKDAKAAKWDEVPCHIWIPKGQVSRIPPVATLPAVKRMVTVLQGVACPIADWGSPLFTGEKQHYNNAVFLKGRSSYLEDAHRGTISDCARVYWVKVLKYAPETKRALIRTLTTDELAKAREVRQVTGAWIEADLLHPLIRGRDIGRYCCDVEGWHQLIPNRHYEKVDSEEDFADKYPLTYSYLKNYEGILKNRASYKRYQSHLPFYVIYCVGDYSFAPHKVLWMEQQDPKAFRTCVISSVNSSLLGKRIVVPDHKLYFTTLHSTEEAHYLCGVLNSRPVRTWLGGFLLGKQIGTTIFEYMKIPRYDKNTSECRDIADISRQEHERRGTSTDNSFAADATENRLDDLVRKLCK
ncbi:MAG: N-6 DNA methylase [Planctomycetota bacterium]